jgi:ABC-2 type transport system permease protein
MTFDNINGWKPYELLFLFSLIFLTYGVLIIFFTGLRDIDTTINNGSFDRLLLRPRGVLFQVIASNADWFAALGHGGLGIVLFIISANKIDILWNTSAVIYYIFSIIGGTLIQGAMFLIFASLCFYVMKSSNIREVFYWNMRKFAAYPISIFPKLIQYIMIYVIPFAFVNYFPAQYLLRKEDVSAYPEIFMYISPIVGVCLYLLAYLFWKLSLKHYVSSGN